MASINRVLLMGTLGFKPQIKHTTKNNKPYCRLSLATNDWAVDSEGKRRTMWHQILVYGKQAEVAAEYLDKGRQVFVEGRLENQTGVKDGQKTYSTWITASRVTFLGGPRSKDDFLMDTDPENTAASA